MDAPPALWHRLSDSLCAQIGLHFAPERHGELAKGIAAAAAAFGMPSAEACASWLSSATLTREQIGVLAGCLAIGETYFFRDRPAFEVLERRVLNDLCEARAGGERRLRIWSAGCCTGEEPYSIAMSLTRAIPDIDAWRISILATDINPQFLRWAALGKFGAWSFRGMAPELKNAFFHATPDGLLEIAPRIRRMVRFDCLNLAQDEYPGAGTGTDALDIVFCRNVLMYFAPETTRAVLDRLSRCLAPGGWLVVGAAETAHVSTPDFTRVHFGDAIVYRKVSPLRAPDRPAKRNPAAGALRSMARRTEALPEVRTMAQRARASADRGSLGEALEWCDRALLADKSNPTLFRLRGAILQEARRLPEAASALRQALYLDQDHAPSHFALGNLILRQGKRAAAERHFRAALSLLERIPCEATLPGTEGLTAGSLAAAVRAALSREMRA